MDTQTWLLYPADDDVDADEGLTKQELLELLAKELGYTVVKTPNI